MAHQAAVVVKNPRADRFDEILDDILQPGGVSSKPSSLMVGLIRSEGLLMKRHNVPP